jgi:hypothetical protein
MTVFPLAWPLPRLVKASRTAGVLRERAGPPSEHRISSVERRYALADGRDLAGQIHSGNLPAGPAQSEHQAHDVRNASQQVPIPNVQSCGPNAHEHFAGSGHGRVDVTQLQDSGVAIGRLNHRPHLVRRI